MARRPEGHTDLPAVPGQAPRTFVDQLAQAWRTSPSTLWIGAGVVGLYQLVLWTGPLASRAELHSWGWLGVNLGVLVVLVARRRFPLATVALLTAVATGTEIITGAAGFAIPFVVAVYTLVTTASPVRIGAGLTACSAYCALLALVAPFPAANRVLPFVVITAAVVGTGFGSRSRRQTLERRDAALAARATEQLLAEQRDAARRQARIATELHDSVGHNLTAIIALTEGLQGLTGDPDLDEAIATVNSLARDGLNDTRRAVAAILPGDRAEPRPRPRGWDAIGDLLAGVRATGLAVALTETGRRPDDEALGVLVHTVVREALTNTMRHATGATRVVISLDHRPARTELTVSDDGRTAEAPLASSSAGSGQSPLVSSSAGPADPRPEDLAESPLASGSASGGHGLQGMSTAVAEAGGSVSAGPGPAGWVVRATLPHTSEEA
ncbi:MAG: histidine kinase [Actinomycetia bacterium]|nr:histidine kinase [Actinomycetes bacterium]